MKELDKPELRQKFAAYRQIVQVQADLVLRQYEYVDGLMWLDWRLR
jgi:hypothetical protein